MFPAFCKTGCPQTRGRTQPLHGKARTCAQAGPLMDYLPYTSNTGRLLQKLADLEPETMAIMHGSSYSGNCKNLLTGLDPVLKEVFAKE